MKNLIRELAFFCLLSLFVCVNVSDTNGQPSNRDSVPHYVAAPLASGFSHNDYCHKHPLDDALENGFANVEADIFLMNGKLIVAHIFPYFKGRRTLESLYLKPLSERIAKNNGRVLAGYDSPVILMIDIKTNAGNTYKVLKPLLGKYKSMLSGCENGKVVYRAVTIVLSGNKPYEIIKNEGNRLAFIDEDLLKVSADSTGNNMFIMASCKYSSLLKWDGEGTLSAIERGRLLVFVAMAHKIGAKVRLWASPEKKAVWDELLRCGVDLINTDQLLSFKKYLEAQSLANAD
jgi:hypothetical protein